MQADERLARLAEAAGVEPRYWDIQGRLYETTPGAARALLGALDLPAGSDGEIAASLELLSEEKWGAPLPPVAVAREHEEILAPLRLPLDGAKTVRWSVRLESGESRAGECDLQSLPIEETGFARGAPVGLRRFRLAPLPAGYHELRLEAAKETVCLLIVAPARCYLPAERAGGRFWGVSAQLYALRSSRDWGVGDLGDLRTLIELTAAHGADAIGVNPLHSLFLDEPERASPYSPNSRLFRNPLYLDVTAVPDFAESDAARAFVETPEMTRAISAARAGDLVDYMAVAEIKLAVLEQLHRSFEANHAARASARGLAFRDFVERSGEALQRFAAFQMLSEHFGGHDWRSWPRSFRDCESRDVAALRRRNAHRVAFFSYLQWLCEEQFLKAAEEARGSGMAIGLYNDLAVGADAASADHWAYRDVYAGGLRVGAPPDPFNERGQEWGVIPLNPRRLRAARYAHFIALLRANMREAGALRIDHVMGWRRLFLIPVGAPPASGAYVNYPLDDLLAIAALESRRNRCLLIGEDLGTVPEGFRERMTAENVLSCRVFYFEREQDRFRPPEDYPTLAATSASTHDLPTLRGFWRGEDIAAKARLGTFGSPEEEQEARAARARDKRRLLQALGDEGLLPEGTAPSDADHLDWTPALARAVHVYLGRTPSLLLMVQLDDLANQLHQANLPGSIAEHPNWRIRLSRPLADCLNDPAARAQMDAIALARRAQQ